jgi:L-ribulose-5-phosphate 3-epimerase
MARRLGVCSWSLRPEGPADLVESVRRTGLRVVQLALDPLRTGEWDEQETLRVLDGAGIEIASGMMGMAGEDYSSLESIKRTGGVRPDEHWSVNLEAARANADLAGRLGLDLVTFHAGFIPHTEGGAHDPLRGVMVERLRAIVEPFTVAGVDIGFETGQETAATLIEALDEIDRPGVFVNFDPANMILYGMGDPVEAIRLLAPRVRQVHLKDATPSRAPGEWGTEVPLGEGDVDWAAFFRIVEDLDVDMMIEREAGETRLNDVAAARGFAEQHL